MTPGLISRRMVLDRAALLQEILKDIRRLPLFEQSAVSTP